MMVLDVRWVIRLSYGRGALDIDVSVASRKGISGEFLHLRCLDATLAVIPSVRSPIFAGTIHAKLPVRSGGGSLAGAKIWGSCTWWLCTLARMEPARKHGRLGLVSK
jgi:hypothetical protein